MTPKISVIIPIFNSEKYLKKCIDSILNQKYKDYEIVLVDDASTDDSGKICDEYSEKYEFIKTVHKEHGGPTHTRKAGLRAAVGEYVSFIDSDDYITSDMYEYLADKLIKYDADIAICNISMETEKAKIPLSTNFEEGIYDKEALEKTVYPRMLYEDEKNMPGLYPSLCNKIIRRTILENVMNGITDDIYFGEDGICAYPSLLEARSVYISKDKFFYIYRQTVMSVSRQYDKRLLKKLPMLISVFDEEFEKRNFDGRRQINMYAALQLIHSVRNELLYNKIKSVRQKVNELKEYLKKPRFGEIFDTVEREKIDKQTKLKIFLMKNGQLYLLYVLFFVKEKILLLKEKKK